MTTGELVAVGDLALVGDVDAHQLVDARGKLVALLAVEDLDADDRAGLAVRDLQRRVADLAGLLAEDRAQQPLLRGQLGLTLGRDLADQQVAVADLGTDADDPALVQVRQDLLGDVGDVPRDLLGAQLGVAGVDLVLLDVDRGQGVVLHQALGEDDRVLIVVALPRHERHEEVLAQGHLAAVGRGTVGDHRADLEPVAGADDDALVVAVALVGPGELHDPVGLVGPVVVGDADQVGRDLLDHAGLGRQDHVAGVERRAVLHAGPDQWGLRAHQRHGLTHHVGAHERAVGVVVLQERDQRRGGRHHLARGHVHVVDVRGRHEVDLAALGADQDALLGEATVRLHRGVGLRDDELVLLVGRQVVHLVGHDALVDLAVGGLHEAERVDPPVGRQRADQTDVGTLRGLDRAHAAVVRRVDVTNLHAGTVTGQTTRAQRGQTTLVRQAGQGVVLVHELRQLRGAEELLDRGHHGADVDQGLRGDRFDVLRGHALADDALHAGQAGADLVLDELADVAQTAVAEVVDVVDLDAHVHGLAATRARQGRVTVVQGHEVLDRRDDVIDAQDGLVQTRLDAELLVDLVATDLGQVVALGVEVKVVQESLGGLLGRRLARAQLAVDVQQRVVLAGRVVLLQGLAHRLVLAELLEDLRLGPAQRLEQHRDRLLALAVDAHAHHVALVDLELQPRATARDHLGGVDVLVGGLVRGPLEVDARGTHQLGHHDTLGAVDDERAALGHEREVTHEHRLGLDLTGVGVHELRRHEQRGGVGHVPLLALLDRVLLLLEPVVAEREGHGAGEVLDRRDLLEDLLQTGTVGDVVATGVLRGGHTGLPALVAEQPVEALRLERQEVRDLQRLLDLCEGQTTGSRLSSGHSLGRGSRGSQGWSFHGPGAMESKRARAARPPGRGAMRQRKATA